MSWVRALRRIGSGVVDHRTSAVPLDVLLRVVEEGAAPSNERASAAVALMTCAEPEVIHRVRIAAETTASPKLRIALTRIAEAGSDETELAGALEEVGEAAAPRRAEVDALRRGDR